MLNLNAMHFLIALLMIFFSSILPNVQHQEGDDRIAIVYPQPGDALQGVINIGGQVNPEEFSAYEVSFGYQEDESDARFLLSQGNQPIDEGTIAVWDTNLISDGNYRLILRVTFTDGRQEEMVISDLRVRNYTTVETIPAQVIEAVTPVPPTATIEPSLTPIRPSPTAFAPNPGTITQGDVLYSLTRGISFSLIFFIFLGTYITLKRRSRR